MARHPEHPLHPTLTAWAEWMRAGAHDNQGWPGISVQAPERNEGGDRPPPGPRMPRQNPPPPAEWLRITRAMKRMHRDRIARQPAEAVMRYYVRREGGWSLDCTRGCDMIFGALVVKDLD